MKCQICGKEIDPLDIYDVVDDETGRVEDMCEECFFAGKWPEQEK